MAIKNSMNPVGSRDATLLVLGSLPGEASLLAQQYYAHPTNQFWRLLGAILGEELCSLSYEERLLRLLARRVALWDVVARASRAGSLDSAIRDATHNALAEFAKGHPELAAVGFNGKTAAAIGRRAIGQPGRIELIDLPSSSAALTMSYDQKLVFWQALAPFVHPA